MEVLVLFNYDGQAEDELTIRKGDVILDVKKLHGGWWEGLLGSKRGLFPDNFVMVVTEAEMSHNSPSSVLRTDKGRKCRVLFSYSPSHEDELELLVGDEIHFLGEVEEGWWRGKLGGKVGVFPSNFVILEDVAPQPLHPLNGASTKLSTSTDVAPELPPKPLKELARVIFPYNSMQPDELELKEGDIVIIHSKECEDKGWWKGELNNKVGVFPDNFVELLPPSSGKVVKPDQQHIKTASALVAEVPQIRGGSVKKDLVFGIPSNTSVVNSHSSSETFKPNTLPNEVTHLNSLNTSLSDEQKLQQVGEADIFHLLPMTESLKPLTDTRVRPSNKRRPPSALFFKDADASTKNQVSSPQAPQTLVSPNIIVPHEDPVQSVQRPATKTRTSMTPPWMEELKRNQEKKGVPVSGSVEKPSINQTKPTVQKPNHSSLSPVNSSSSVHPEGDIPNSSEALVKGNVGAKINAVKPAATSAPRIPLNPKPVIDASNKPVIVPSLSLDKNTIKDDFAGAKKDVGRNVQETKIIGPPPNKSPSNDLRDTSESPKHELPSGPKRHAVPLGTLSTEEAHSTNFNESILAELQSLKQRVITLEATVKSLQTELLHFKSSTPGGELECQSMQNNQTNRDGGHLHF